MIISAIVSLAILLSTVFSIPVSAVNFGDPNFGFAGGGGSSSGGGGGGGFSGGSSYSHSSSSSSSNSSDDEDPFILTFTLIIVVIIVIFSFKSSGKITKRSRKYNSIETKIIGDANQIFLQYQKDWTEFNKKNIKTYTTLGYGKHADLMLELLQNLHRTNKVSQVKISNTYLITKVNENTPLPIEVRVEFTFSGLDEVITDDGQKLYSQYVPSANETWNFVYDGKALKLSGITQPTESSSHLIRSLADFAKEHKLYYSPDWGRYALPSRGLIFGGASMKIADINNHIIGKWGDLLIQLYTYAETPDQTTNNYYIVGQINVPKNYLGVIVKSHNFKSGHKPDKSYDKFELEWNEFNKRYEVYAASRDALPAFELLNPKFMEFLYSKNPSYSLEVVDNVIYIYAPITTITERDYEDLLEVLQKAYDELKM